MATQFIDSFAMGIVGLVEEFLVTRKVLPRAEAEWQRCIST
jgi:hypothetical protein